MVKTTTTAAQRAVAYLVLDGIVHCGKYYPQEIAEWANDLMVNEQRVGTELVREAIAEPGSSLTRLTAQRNRYWEQVEVLTAIAKEALLFREETHGRCDHDESMVKLCTQCEIREALAAVAEESEPET